MKPKSTDIPQAPDLRRLRRLVDAVAAGATDRTALEKTTGMARRAVGYYLNAAERALRLVEKEQGELVVTPLGARLARSVPESEDERSALIDAVRTSPVVKALAGDLLGVRMPSRELIRRRMAATGLSERTADQRAGQLLRWREHLLREQRSLPYVQATATADAARERLSTDPSDGGESRPSPPMLSSLRLHDFKSFADVTVPMGPLTVLVGANASGKSNALDALRFLQGIGLELPVSDVLRGRHEGGREVWPAIRGGLAEVCRWNRHEFELESTWQLEGETLTHLLRCTTKPVPLVIRESLKGEDMGTYLFDSEAKALGTQKGLGEARSLNVALRSRGGRNATQKHSAAMSLLGQIAPKSGGRIRDEVFRWAEAVQGAMREATFLNIRPNAMRDYAPAQALELGADGRNISAIVRQLCEQEPGWKERLVGWLSELCAPQLRDIDFVETELGDVMLRLVEEDGTRVSARSLSDGTLRFLGELVALLTASPGTILLIEEIENGLHPQRMHLLVELLEMVTEKRGIQVIATTHSPLVLQGLSEEALERAVVFARLPDRPGTVAKRLGELAGFDEVRQRRGVDRLFAAGWLELAL